jgi:ribosomal-protein-alanine N-acetyltransferase
MLIAGGSFVAGSDNPHDGTSMPLGPSTPSDQLIGGVGLDGSNGDDSAEPALGYWLGLPYWARGYGREAVAAAIHYGLYTLGLATIRAVTDPDNVASQKVLLACGLSKVADIDLVEPMRSGARRAPLFRICRHDNPAP